MEVSQNYSVLLPELIHSLIFTGNGKDFLADLDEKAADLFCARVDGLNLGAFVYFFLHEENFFPSAYEKKFSMLFRAMSAAEMKRFTFFKSIFKIFSENNIVAAPLKGAALAYTCYPHPALRGMSDLDVLVRPDEIHGVRQLMLANGFVADGLENPKHLPALRSPSGQVLELHRHISIDASYPIEYLWEEIRTASFLDFKAAMLSPELNILHAIDHAFLDNLVGGFKAFIDVAFIISRQQPDPAKIEQLALKLGMYPKLAFFMNILPGFFPEEYCFAPEADSADLLKEARFLILNAGQLQGLDKHVLKLARDYAQLSRKEKLNYLFGKLIRRREIMENKYKRPMNLTSLPFYYCRDILEHFSKFVNFSSACADADFRRAAGKAQQRIRSYLKKRK